MNPLDALIAYFLGVAVGGGLVEWALRRAGWRAPQPRCRRCGGYLPQNRREHICVPARRRAQRAQ